MLVYIINLYKYQSVYLWLLPSVAAKDSCEHSEVVLVDHAGVVLVEGHHHAHRGTEQGNVAVLDVAHQAALEHESPGGLEGAGKAVQGQFHLAAGGLDQDSETRNDTVEEVVPVTFALGDPAQPAGHIERSQDIDGQEDTGSEGRLDIAVGGLLGIRNDALVLEDQGHNLRCDGK